MSLKISMQISRHRHANKSSSHGLFWECIVNFFIFYFGNSVHNLSCYTWKCSWHFFEFKICQDGGRIEDIVINSLHETPFKVHIVMPLTLMPRWLKNRRYTVISSLHETPCKAHIVIWLTLKVENTLGIHLTPCKGKVVKLAG